MMAHSSDQVGTRVHLGSRTKGFSAVSNFLLKLSCLFRNSQDVTHFRDTFRRMEFFASVLGKSKNPEEKKPEEVREPDVPVS
jgi:hypothetical protein